MRTAFMLPLLFLVAAPAPASAQTLSVTPGRLSFLAAEGSAAPVPQQVTVRPAVGATFTWRAMPSAPWLRVSPATGQGTETVTVTINATALAAGSYAARITIAAVGGMNVAPVVVDVSVQIAARKPAAAPPARGAAPSTGAQHAAPVAGGKPGGVTLAAPEGSTDPVESSVTIESPRTGAIEWFARTDKSWLAAEPRSGVTPGRVTVRANPAGLAAGSYTALLQIVDDAREPMLDVPVVLTVGSPAAAAPEPQGAAAPAAKPVETPAAPTTTEAETQAQLSIAGNALPPAIRNLPYSGISVGWGWGEEDAGGGGYVNIQFRYSTPTPCGNNRIEFNHIHDVMRLRNDGGGIYTLGNQQGTIIRGNHIHDNNQGGGPGGIYLDEGSGFIEVTGNAVHNVETPMNYNNKVQNRIAT